MDALKRSLAIFYIVVCLTFITWLMIINEWRLAIVAIILSSFIMGDILKDFKKIFIQKPKPHVCKFETYLTTGHGITKAFVQRCECGAEQVIHSKGTFKI